MRFGDLPIHRKLRWVTGATTAAALLLASVFFVGYDVFVVQRRLVRQLETQADIVGYNSSAAVLFGDREAATRTLAALRAEPQIVAAGVYDREGEAFATYARKPGAPIDALTAPLDEDGYHFDSGYVLVYRRIVVDRDEVGTVRLVADLGELQSSIVQHLMIAAGVFLMAMGLALPLLGRLQRVISGPILHLVERARMVSEHQNYGVRAVATGSDELGLLVRTFNEMLAQIQKRDQDLERARDDAQRANRAKDEFLAVVSHELRTPLSPVLAWTHMLRDADLAPERRAHALDVIERNVKSQAQIVEDLLDVSRIITGKLRLHVQPVDVVPVVESAVDAVRPTAEMKGVRLQTTTDPPLSVVGDAERLKQVVWNLLSNAIKFTPKGGSVHVVAHRVDSTVEIAVRDTGSGIAEDFLPFVFDRFRQADSTSTRRHTGLGIGLAIVRHLVELHGGQVRAESGGEGKGATFTIALPISPVHEQPEERPAAREAQVSLAPAVVGPSIEGLRVLCVDDEPDTLETIRVLLERAGATVRAASTASEALQLVEDWRPDVLISDIGMPGEDGYELIRRVRKLGIERGGHVPAIALTAYARVEDRLQVLSAGFQMHVPKPIEPAELIAIVHSLGEWSKQLPTGTGR